MYAHRGSPAGISARRLADRGPSSSMVSQTNGSFTESSVNTPSVYSEGRHGGHASRGGPALPARFPPSSSASPTPEHMDDTHFYAGLDSASTSATSRENFRVVVRVRPPLPRELHGYRPFVDVVQLSEDQANTITLCDALDTEDGRGAVYSRQSYTFDRVYGADTTQEELYDVSARPAVLSVLDGYNATLMAYGQTGTGKTYTMEGFTNEEERGVIPRAVEDVFAVIHERRSASPHTRFLVRASYMQIYNEVISDLLDMPPHTALGGGGSGGGRSSLAVRHTPQRGVYVDGLSEWVVRSPEDVYGLIAKGTALRATSATKLSELSSRSHAIFTIVVEAMEGDEANPQAYRFGKLHIVDLAGSEKIRLAGVTGQRLEETKNINKSLHELGNVIAALAAKSSAHSRRGGAPPRHIPFRNSALTSALRDSLGGNCKTTLVACISPALESYAESLSTLMFANRAKNIQTHAVVNAGVNQSTLLRAYEQELRRLRQQLQERTAADAAVDASLAGGSPDASGRLFAMEEDRRRAEQDRAAALAALQQSSVAYQEELRIREGLEGRILELEAVLREGGMEGNPRTSDEYADRLLELDRERQAVAEDKEQVERYKHLLLKQRDIMLSLTTRLNDRDETILLLQEEVDAYDQHVQSLEEELEAVLQEGGSGAEDGERRPPSFVVNAQRVGRLSEAQAVAYVQQLRAGQDTTPGSNNTNANGSAAPPAFTYRSLLQPTRTITAEQLAVELVMLQGRCEPVSSATSPRSAASSSSHHQNDYRSGTGVGGTMQEATPTAAPLIPGLSEAELTTLMRQRADNIVRSHYDQLVAQLRCTVAELTLQLRNSEDKAAVAEKAVDQLVRRQRNGAAEAEGPRGATAGSAATGAAAASNGVSDIRAALQREWESRRHTYVAAIDALQDAARTDGVERARLGREVDRLRLEVQHLLESTTGSASTSGSQPNQQQQQQHSSVAAAARQAWQRLQEVEERVRRQGVLAQLPQLNSAPPASTSHERGEKETLLRESMAREAALTATVQRLEREAAALRSALDASRLSSSTLLTTTATAATTTAADGPAAGEVAHLRQQLLVHEKDRRALRTILEQRMRGKIDRICEMVASESASSTGSGGKLGSEARSLQGLIHASIKAMDVDV